MLDAPVPATADLGRHCRGQPRPWGTKGTRADMRPN